MATRSSLLAWKIPWTEELGGLQSMGSQKSQTRLSDWAQTHNLVLGNILFLLFQEIEPILFSHWPYEEGALFFPIFFCLFVFVFNFFGSSVWLAGSYFHIQHWVLTTGLLGNSQLSSPFCSGGNSDGEKLSHPSKVTDVVGDWVLIRFPKLWFFFFFSFCFEGQVSRGNAV